MNMAENLTSATSVKTDSIREAVCIHTNKIFDSCMDKDCIEDLHVILCPGSQSIINTAISIRPKSAILLNADVRVDEINFNKGCYAIDVTYFYKVTGEAFPGERTVTGLAIFEKRVILYGGVGGSKTFSSVGKRHPRQSTLPVAIVEAVDPLPLSMKITDHPICDNLDFETREVPDEIAEYFDGGLLTGPCSKNLYVTLGQFSIISLERDTQLLMPIYDYCIPDKECAGSEDDPCTLFASIPFPINDFFPPKVKCPNCTVE